MRATGRVVNVVAVFFLFSFLFLSFGLSGSGPLGQSAAWAAEKTVGADEEITPQQGDGAAVSDPLQGFNKAMFEFNDKLYFWGLKPVGQVYGTFIPPGVRRCIRNAYTNVMMPVRFVNNVLQGKLQNSGVELARFFINTTMGAGGMFEVAEPQFHLEAHKEDFGQTLGVWGVGTGAYIVLPFFGPSSARDSVGLIADSFMNPIYYAPIEWYESAGIKFGMAMNDVSLRIGEYEDFKKATLDPYVSMRDAYLEHRVEEIKK